MSIFIDVFLKKNKKLKFEMLMVIFSKFEFKKINPN
jgi:uncharacterized membrane protein YwzB